MFCGPTVGVRTQWSFDLALACQRFVGGVLDPEPEELVRAVDDLAKALPEPESQVERFTLRDKLLIATDNAARQFHTQFHRCMAHQCNCGWRTENAAFGWDSLNRDPSRLLSEWVSGYLLDFARSHEWPSPILAARVIRGSFDKPLDVDRIARTVGCARSGLIRSFRDAYGMSMGDYNARCRLRPAVVVLREPDSNVGAAAFQVGYQSTKNFYRALREVTGMTPSQVRGLSDDDAREVLGALLESPAPTFTKAGTELTRRAV